MTDASSSPELRLTNKEAIEGYFQRRPSNFSRTVLGMWADANDDLLFKFDPGWKRLIKKPAERVSINENIVTFHHSPTLGDILQAAQLLRETPQGQEPDPKFQNSTLERLGLMLVDSAIYLAHQDKGKEHKEQIETLFNLGANLEVRAKRANASPLMLKFEQIINCETNPFKHPFKQEGEQERKQRQKNYEDSLLLFLLGKHTIYRNKKGEVLPYISYYDQHYHQWLQDNDLEDIVENQQQFENELLQNRGMLLDSIFSQLGQDLQPDEFVDQLAEQKILQRLDEAIQDKGQTKLEQEMSPSPLVEDLGKELLGELEEIYGHGFVKRLREDQLKLFAVAGEVISRLKRKPTYEKIVALWDLVQEYEFQKTYVPKKAIAEKALECNLRTYLLSSLLDRHLKDEVIIFQENLASHSILLVIDRNSLKDTTSDPVVYFVDPAMRRWCYTQDGRMPYWSQDQAVYRIQDQEFINQIIQAWLVNPKFINLNLKLNDQEYLQFFSEEDACQKTYQNIINPREGIRSCLWVNLSALYSEIEHKRACLLKSLELNPNNINTLGALGNTYKYVDEEKARKCYLKAFELSPYSDKVCYSLSATLINVLDPQTMLGPQVLKKLENWLKRFISGEIKPDWRTENRIYIAKQVLEKIKTANSQI
jgi:hypothetical protein